MHVEFPLAAARALPFAAALALAGALPAGAAPADDLYDVLRLDDLLAVMRTEGLASGAEMAAELGLRADATWEARVSEIYDLAAMEGVLRAGIDAALDPEFVPAITAFFTTAPGAQLLDYELAAREALLDPDVEAAAQAAAARALAEDGPRINQIATYIGVNDIIESNVMGGMNGSYAFYRGMRAGGALPAEVTDEILLQDVWQQEELLRENTTDWAYSYLFMAYAPASDADLDAYIAFSESEAGQEMTATLFAGFDLLFVTLSEAMGLAVAQRMATTEL